MWLLWGLLLWLTLLMVRITVQYIPYSSTVAFLQIKQTEVIGLWWYLPVFYTHVYTALFTLAAGFTQFQKRLLRPPARLHRAWGYFYVILILFLAAPSGLLMGWVANGGVVAQAFFMTLAACWWLFTAQALRSAQQKRFLEHRDWMLRSYALTLSAITLRLWKLILVKLFAPAPMDVYIIVSGLSWIPNWLIAEWIIFRKYRKVPPGNLLTNKLLE